MPLLRHLARLWTIILACTALTLSIAVAARLLVPFTPWPAAPSLLSAEPADGAVDVLPRTPIVLRFSGPTNRTSVARALRIDPPTPGELRWSDDATALTFTPTDALTPNITYTVSLAPSALGRWWKPLEQAASVQFRTAPQPAVVTALPQRAGVAPASGLAVVFSQPMVTPEQVGQPTALPQLSLSPSVELEGRWLDQRTLLLRPAAPLAPATRYTATIGAGLADLRGIELGAPFTWDFTTAWPGVIERAPATAARWVSPRTPLTLRLDAPLDEGLIRQALRIAPAISGTLEAERVGATQVITFTPSAGWEYGTSYNVSLAEPPGSDLGAPAVEPWSFEVQPQPRLVAVFPGQGQLLAPGQPIRLVFSTPMDEGRLRAGISVEPPVDELPLSVSETEVRLTPNLRPSTLYTITVAPDIADRAGEPLSSQAVVRLRTTPARPALTAPDAFAGLLTLPVSQTAAVALETTNLTALDLSLYQLDQATLLRALELRPEQRRDFSPERYGQQLVRAWRVERNEPLDQATQLALPVGLADGDPLAPGAYMLRAVSPEGPRSDLLLLVSSTRLTLRQSPSSALVWATDSSSGAPVPGLPVALFRGGALVAQGVTGQDGTWAQAVSGASDEALLAIAEAGGPALVQSDWAAEAPTSASYRSLLFADRLAYRPGESVRVGGLARRQLAGGQLALPEAGAVCQLQLRSLAGAAMAPATACAIDAATGKLSGEVALAQRLAPGPYQIAAQIGDESTSVALSIEGAEPPAENLGLAVSVTPSAELRARISRNGLPLGGAGISWTLQLEPLLLPEAPAGYTLGPLEPSAPFALAGGGTTDADGFFTTDPLGDARGATGQRYRLRAALTAGDDPGFVETEGVIPAAAPLTALSLPSRLVASDRRSTVDMLALDEHGQPAAGARLIVQVFPVGATGAAPLLFRQATAGDDGRASVQLVQLNPGAYDVIAASTGGPASRTRLWVYGGRFAGWSAAAGQVELVADRERYSPGDVATLLVAAPEPQASLLLAVERDETLSTTVRSLRAGQVITVPITSDMAPGVSITALVTAGESWRRGTASLRVVDSSAPLTVGLDAGPNEYLPGATATLTITTGDGASPVTSDLLVTIAPEPMGQPVPPPAGLSRFAPDPPRPNATAALASAAAMAPAGAGDGAQAQPPGVALALDTGAGGPGTVVARATLPAQPGRWRLTAYGASGAEQIGAASTIVTTSLPLDYTLVTPAALRAGDSAALALDLRNTSAVTRDVRLSLSADGLSLRDAGSQTVTLGPGNGQRLTWEIAPLADAERAALSLTITTDGFQQATSRSIPFVGPLPFPAMGSTIVASGALATELRLPDSPTGTLQIALAPGLRAALADQAEQLANRAPTSVEDAAALGVIAAALAEGGGSERERWAQLAGNALDSLDSLQQADGGWGWWASGPSQPFISAFALEGQIAAQGVVGGSRQPSPRAITYLSRVSPAADADTQAYIAYVLARAGRANGEPGALPAAQLSADGLAFLALALPPAQAGATADSLRELAIREPAAAGEFPTVRWEAAGVSNMPRSATAVTAAAVQAIGARRPGDSTLPGAERALLAAWGVDGWPSGYEAARVAAALLGGAPTSEGGPRQLSLGGSPLLGDGGVISSTLRAELPAAGLGPRPALEVQAAGPAPYLVAYRATVLPQPGVERLALIQELLDANSGAPLEGRALRPGQLVALRVTAVVLDELPRADLTIPLPGGLEALSPTSQGPFTPLSGQSRGSYQLDLGAAAMAPGVYTYTVTARAIAAGSFQAPPALLRAHYAPDLAAVAPSGTAITITE